MSKEPIAKLSDKELELKILQEQRKSAALVFIPHFIWGPVVLILGFATIIYGLPAIAGKETNFIADIQLNVALSFAFGVCATIYGIWKHSQMKKMEKIKDKIIENLESKLRTLSQNNN